MMFLRATSLLRMGKRTAASTGARTALKRSPVVSAAESSLADCEERATGQRKSQRSGAVASLKATAANNAKTSSAFIPDHREKVLQIFNRLAEINNALQERYKAQSYQIALEKLKRDDFIFVHLPPNIVPPGVDDSRRAEALNTVNTTAVVGDKLKAKIVEILSTGDLAELHSLQAKPIIRAIQELTQVHGVGPRTAVTFYKKYGIKSVSELQQRMREQEAEMTTAAGGSRNGARKSTKKSSSDDDDSVPHLTEAQRLGLKYHRDIMQRIPYEEVRLHEAFLKLRLRKYLGKGYELSICGSYRRRLPTSGDIDVLITRKMSGKNVTAAAVARQRKNKKDGCDGNKNGEQLLEPQEVLAAFVQALKEERYIEATLAQGATKFMGVSRLKSYNYNAGTSNPKLYPARRLDIRFVEPECFPAALLYFTGSKNFNVVMRAEAIKQNFVLNEYGLFRNDAVTSCSSEDNEKSVSSSSGKSKPNKNTNDSGTNSARGRWNAEAFQKLVRAQYYSAKSPAFMNSEDDEDGVTEDTGSKGNRKKESASRQQQQQHELAALWREVESRRMKVKHERDIFDALGMTYVHPEHREM